MSVEQTRALLTALFVDVTQNAEKRSVSTVEAYNNKGCGRLRYSIHTKEVIRFVPVSTAETGAAWQTVRGLWESPLGDGRGTGFPSCGRCPPGYRCLR
jgi:hypothetical protein